MKRLCRRVPGSASWTLALLVLARCGDGAICRADADCAAGEVCARGTCARSAAASGADGARAFATDPWGDRWDSALRPAGDVAAAEADCARAGGRLPTASELYRTRLDGPWPLNGAASGAELWSATPSAIVGTRIAVNNVSGVAVPDDESALHPFRCIVARPRLGDDGFGAAACNGPPDAPCVDRGDVRADALDRPSLDWAGAAWECRQAGAALPSMGQAQELAQGGGGGGHGASWPDPTGAWLWSSQAVTVPGTMEVAIATWRASLQPEPGWTYGGDDAEAGLARGSYVRSTERRAFRCIGRTPSATVLAPAPPPGCFAGECLEAEGAPGRIVADAASWGTHVDWFNAFEVCRLVGGTLPTLGEAAALFDAGWAAPGPGEPGIWTEEVVLGGPSDVRLGVVARSGPSGAVWHPESETASAVAVSSPQAVRCVWSERRAALNVPCPIGTVQKWSGDALVCVTRVPGSSCAAGGGDCAAQGGEFRDLWSNAWDAVDRGPLRFDKARARCDQLGGRLPTASELARIGSTHGIFPRAIAAPSSGFLWTVVPDALAAHRVSVRLSDGAVGRLSESEESSYRCLWPATRGDLLDPSSCNGPQDYPCQHIGLLRFDRAPRPALPQSSAAWECAFDGGRLPLAREFAAMVRGRVYFPAESWLAEPLIGADGRPRYAAASFLDEWSWGFAGNSAREPNQSFPFRCVLALGTEAAVDWYLPRDWVPQ